MEQNGLVVRERSKEDRRVVFIRLTPKGRRLADDVPVEPWEIFRGALESLTAAEVRDLVKILGKVARRVKQTVRAGSSAVANVAGDKESAEAGSDEPPVKEGRTTR